MERLSWLWQDLRYGVRGLRKDRTLALLASLALALGIGATTVIFSVIDNVLLEPFPYKGADRLANFYIHDTTRTEDFGRGDFSIAEYLDYKEQNHVFEGLIANRNLDVLYTDNDGTRQFRGGETSTDTFDFLGINPLYGRYIVPDDARPDAPAVAVMSYRLWQKEFNSDPKLIGRVLTFNSKPTTLIGIMPPRFLFGGQDIWLPLSLNRSQSDSVFLHVWTLGRLKPGVSLQSAASDFDVIARRLSKLYPDLYPQRFDIKTASLTETVVGQFKVMLYALMAAVTMLVVMLVIGNLIADLLLAVIDPRIRVD